MMPKRLQPLEEAPAQARWLHDLRSAVSTAHVATAMGRRMLADDVPTAMDLLQEAEHALLLCRELLLSGAVAQLQADGAAYGRMPVAGDAIAGITRCTVGDEIARNQERRRGPRPRAVA